MRISYISSIFWFDITFNYYGSHCITIDCIN